MLVSRAESSTLREAARASAELAGLGVGNQRLVLNGLLDDPGDDPAALAFSERQAAALAGVPGQLAALPAAGVGLIACEVTGLGALRQLTGCVAAPASAGREVAEVDLPGLCELIDALDAAGRGVVMTMGKGGVGKTTLAAAIAIALVDRGHAVTLSTTDPAAHLADALAHAAPDRLLVERIDPAVETARYAGEVLAAASGLDDEGRALLEEDLRSPCTEEIAVFRAFARTVDAARERFVVLDTAPTGHTLLLLDAAQAYQREVKRTNANVPAEVSELLARLRNPEFARMLVVTHAESTPVHEAERLQDDLRCAGIEPFGWIINALTSRQRNLALDAPRPRRKRDGAHRTRPTTLRTRRVAGRLAARCAGRDGRAARAGCVGYGALNMATALFVCLHNAGRSQMSAALFERAAQGRHQAISAGSVADPNGHVHPEVVEAMSELGIDLSDRRPQLLTRELAEQADVVVTMGCGDACPVIPGKRYLDWELPDPKGRPIDEVRATRDEILGRVQQLLAELG